MKNNYGTIELNGAQDLKEQVFDIRECPKPSKRNGKIISFLLADFVGCSVLMPILGIMGMFDFNILIEILCIALSVLTSYIIVKKAEKGKGIAEWFRCFFIGLSLCLLIGFLFMGAIATISMGEYRYVIKDAYGTHYAKVLSNGLYEDTNGHVYRVI